MGKKSRSKTTKSAAGRSDETGGTGNGAGAVSVGKQRCVNCCSTLKDTSKAHACPGCSELYCWRCERKLFEECPNGKECVYPMRRCLNCIDSLTMQKKLGDDIDALAIGDGNGNGRFVFPSGTAALFKERIQQDSQLSVHALPYDVCRSYGCGVHECSLCVADPSENRRLAVCSLCHSNPHCKECYDASFKEGSPFRECIVSSLKKMRTELGGDAIITINHLGGIKKIVLERFDDLLVACGNKHCNFFGCLGCLDDKFVISYLYRFFGSEVDFRCNTCYWSAKPCTNPNCPNEPGVPTKRCGDCHLDRYCSVECQAAAYPAHVGRCQKIQEKRMVACRVAKTNDN